jgi:hypothetical protein
MNVPPKHIIEQAMTRIIHNHNKTFRIYLSNVEAAAFLAFQAIVALSHVTLVITGGQINSRIASKMLGSEKVEYNGVLPYDKVLDIEGGVDAFLILYDPSVELSKYRLSGNRFFEALNFGKPVITNIWDPNAYRLYPYILVDYDKNSIRSAIANLRDKNTQQTGEPAPSNLKSDYCWEVQTLKLLEGYRRLFSVCS